MLEVYLHKINKISIGKVIKHDWFKKPKLEQKKNPLIERKLSIKFPKKEEIYKLIYEIEEDRNSLMYGAPKKEKIKKVLKNFQELKEIFKLLLKNEIEL